MIRMNAGGRQVNAVRHSELRESIVYCVLYISRGVDEEDGMMNDRLSRWSFVICHLSFVICVVNVE